MARASPAPTVALGGPPATARIVGVAPGVVRGKAATATTAPDGTYTFNNLPPGTYTALIQKGDPRVQPPGVWSEGVYFAVAEHDVRADDLCLKLPQSVSGTVRDADTGEPIAGAQIRVSTSDLSKISTAGLAGALIFTDEHGRYRLYVRSPKVDLSCDGTSLRYNSADGGSGRSVAVEPAPGDDGGLPLQEHPAAGGPRAQSRRHAREARRLRVGDLAPA